MPVQIEPAPLLIQPLIAAETVPTKDIIFEHLILLKL
jgi:hypothetical protein